MNARRRRGRTTSAPRRTSGCGLISDPIPAHERYEWLARGITGPGKISAEILTNDGIRIISYIMNEVIFACIIITVICIYLLFVRSYFTPPVDEEKHCRRNFRVCYVTFEGIFYLCCGFFLARQRVARFRMSKGSGRRAASRLFKL